MECNKIVLTNENAHARTHLRCDTLLYCLVIWYFSNCTPLRSICWTGEKKLNKLTQIVLQTRHVLPRLWFELFLKRRRKESLKWLWHRRPCKPDGWHRTIQLRHTKPCYSKKEDEQMVEASNLSIQSWQLMIHGKRGECLFCGITKWSGPSKATRSVSFWDGLIRQCLQAYNACEGVVAAI